VAEELCMFVNFLKNDMNSLRSATVTKKATKFVEKLEKLADELQYDDSLISIIEQPSVSSPSMSPPAVIKRKTGNNNNHKQSLKASQQQQTTSTVVSRVSL
jgi:hypothetical protein